MKYLFILGRNPELSIKEIESFLKVKEIKILYSKLIKNGYLIELEMEIDISLVNDFGGVISIGKVNVEGDIDEILGKLENQNIYSKDKNNFSYVIWNYSNEESYDKLSDYLKKRFKIEKFKVSLKPLTGILDMQNGEKINIVGNKIHEQYFLFFDNSKYYFGNIENSYDSDSLEKRDMGKPVRREELAISPRLAKIMINLSEIKNNGRLLDPFCGIGVILFEGLLKNLEVTGIDIDKSALEGAITNLNWGNFNKDNFKIINADSKKINLNSKYDVIVSEPDLGEILRKPVSNDKTKEIIEGFEKLIINVVNNLKKNIEGRIVFSSPFIKTTQNKRLGINVHNLEKMTNLKISKGFPIEDYRKDQIVGRQIIVLDR